MKNQNSILQNPESLGAPVPPTSAAHSLPVYPPLEKETRSHVPTDAAAYFLNRQPQTLRAWACFEHGPIRPVRIFGRLAWSVASIRELLEGGEK